MASPAVMVPTAKHGELWERLQCLAERRVNEGNMLAGERLWEVVRGPGGGRSFVIQSTGAPGGFVVCSFDHGTGVLACRPGPLVKAGPLDFQVPAGTEHVFLPDGRNYTPDQAISLILDQLAWISE